MPAGGSPSSLPATLLCTSEASWGAEEETPPPSAGAVHSQGLIVPPPAAPAAAADRSYSRAQQ
eukprot:8159056-Alexandrium_andersonii.AAC.1